MTSDARFIRADRLQTHWDYIDLEALLPSDHRVRIVVNFVESLDMSGFYDAIRSREGEPGRPPADPAILLALWLYATIEGVGSARQLDRLVERDLAYRWIAGGVSLNYHGLADFRVAHVEILDRLLTESVTALIAEGVISLAEIAIDGTKVRANAGRDSFKTGSKLAQIEAAVERRLVALKAEIASDPEASTRRRQVARERAAREIKERAERARAALDQVRAERAERAKRHSKDEAKKSEPKASLSDPEARNMRFADGAIGPAYNVQIVGTPREGIILSLEMTDRAMTRAWLHRWWTMWSVATAGRRKHCWSIPITPPARTLPRWPSMQPDQSRCLLHHQPSGTTSSPAHLPTASANGSRNRTA